jgi:predicted  nucleic acid-binding Zn-ribbon protein
MEVSYGGISAKGGKLFIIISLIGTIGGGLWGGFEFYKDYQDMKEQITAYVAPDLSGFDKKLEVLNTAVSEKMKVIDEQMGRNNSEVASVKELVHTQVTGLESTVNKDVLAIKELFQGDVTLLKAEVTATQELISTEMASMKEVVTEAQDTIRDIRTTMKTDINEFSDQISAIDKRSRADGLETRQAMRNAENEVRELIADTEERWDDKLQKVDSQIENLETKIDKKITKALTNPLAAMSKTK